MKRFTLLHIWLAGLAFAVDHGAARENAATEARLPMSASATQTAAANPMTDVQLFSSPEPSQAHGADPDLATHSPPHAESGILPRMFRPAKRDLIKDYRCYSLRSNPPPPLGMVPYSELPANITSHLPPGPPKFTGPSLVKCLREHAALQQTGATFCEGNNMMILAENWNNPQDCVTACEQCILDTASLGRHIIGCFQRVWFAECTIDINGGSGLLQVDTPPG